jgi:hypothetical protein
MSPVKTDPIPTIVLTDAWFDVIDGVSRLRIATAVSTVAVTPFWGIVDFQGGPRLVFTYIADIKGRRVFEATGSRPADAPPQASPVASYRLVGPWREGLRDAS